MNTPLQDFFFVLDLQKNFRCIAIDCKYFSSFFSDISTIIGREKSRKLFLNEKKLKKLWQYIFAKKAILFCCTSMQNKRKSLGKIRSYFQHYKLGCKVFNCFLQFLFSFSWINKKESNSLCLYLNPNNLLQSKL